MQVKRLIILVVVAFMPTCFCFSQNMYFCFNYDGYWGDWESCFQWYKIYGSYNGFLIYESHKHPSEYFFNFEINNRTAPSKKEVKEHFKSNTWWEYQGTVEYYVCDVYPTIKDCFKQFGRPLLKSDLETTEYSSKLSVLRATRLKQQGNFVPKGLTKRTARATIKIAPYSHKKLKPKVYNIWFDDVGFGIDLGRIYFKESN